jgi:hypothetical protein
MSIRNTSSKDGARGRAMFVRQSSLRPTVSAGHLIVHQHMDGVFAASCGSIGKAIAAA